MTDAPPPVFTIGPREVYLAAMIKCRESDEYLLKTGLIMAGHPNQPKSYTGGIIFQNPKDARKYIEEEVLEIKKEKMAVFEVKASWEHDCYSAGDSMYWRYLLYNRPIILLVEVNNG